MTDMKKVYTLIAIIMASILFISSCSDKKSDTSTDTPEALQEEEYTPEYGGTIKLASFVPDTLNPLATQYQNVRDVLMIVYEGLFKAESDLGATPVIASGYSVSVSNKIYTIKLRQGIQFHDGKQLDSKDVTATFDYIKKYDTPYTEMFKNVLSYKATDNHTVSIELISPQANFVNNLDFPILPKGLSKESFVSENPYFVPIGTGRFKYDSQVKNKYMTYTRFDDWYGEKETYIDNVRINFLHNSEDIFHAFDSGEIDIFTTNGSNWGEFTFTFEPKIYETPSPRYTFIGINTENEQLKESSLRRDINAALNRKELIENIMFNHAIPANLPLIVYEDAEKENTQTNISPEKDDEEKNYLRAPEFNKYDISLYLLYNKESKEKVRAAEHIKKALEQYGIKLLMQEVDFEDYKNRIAEKNYDLYIGEVVMQNNMNMDFMFNSLHETEQKLCTFKNAEFDTLLNNLNMINSGNENSDIIYENFKKYFYQNVPQIPLFHTNTAIFVNNRIKGNITPNMSSFYTDIGDFYINYKQ